MTSSLHSPTFSAPAKLNLFLHVTGRRDDGMHLLESVFILIDLVDTVTISVNRTGEIHRTGDVVGDPERDLCVRAAQLLQKECGCPFGADIHVDKRIPSGAGLGGGSSDCATTLMALNRLWDLHLEVSELMRLGNHLGADVPFFIFGCSAFARGTGDKLQPVDIPQSHWAIIMPDVPTSTQRIFQDPGLTRDTKSLTIAVLSDQIRLHWPTLPGHNDLQSVAMRVNPAIECALQSLGSTARMTGSGSAVFSYASSHEEALKKLQHVPAGMRGYAVQTLLHHPFEEEWRQT